jgi:hypothetical protein
MIADAGSGGFCPEIAGERGGGDGYRENKAVVRRFIENVVFVVM